MSCSSASVGFWPRVRITVLSSLVVMVPSPSLSNLVKASCKRARSSSVSAFFAKKYYVFLLTGKISQIKFFIEWLLNLCIKKLEMTVGKDCDNFLTASGCDSPFALGLSFELRKIDRPALKQEIQRRRRCVVSGWCCGCCDAFSLSESAISAPTLHACGSALCRHIHPHPEKGVNSFCMINGPAGRPPRCQRQWGPSLRHIDLWLFSWKFITRAYQTNLIRVAESR